MTHPRLCRFLSDDIPYGTNLICIDGRVKEFENNSFYYRQSDSVEVLRISFTQEFSSSQINQLICSTFFPENSKDYIVNDEPFQYPGNMAVSFNQSYDEDLNGWEYKYCGSKDDYFKLEKFDITNQLMSAKGLLRFKRIKKNGAPGGTGIDKVIYVEFAFHDYFEIK